MMHFNEFVRLQTESMNAQGLPPVSMEELKANYEAFCIEEAQKAQDIEEIIESLR